MIKKLWLLLCVAGISLYYATMLAQDGSPELPDVATINNNPELSIDNFHNYATSRVLITPDEFVETSLADEEVVVPTTRKLRIPPRRRRVYIGEDKWWVRTLYGYQRVPPPIPERYR